MEGDVPLNGTPKALHTILLTDDHVAADAELTRLLGLQESRNILELIRIRGSEGGHSGFLWHSDLKMLFKQFPLAFSSISVADYDLWLMVICR
jgi:hypothetical protein